MLVAALAGEVKLKEVRNSTSKKIGF